MKKYMVFAAVLCLCLFISACTSHGDRESAESGQRLITTPVTGWPENDYTREIVQPECGIPDYTVTDESGSFFAVFLKDVTRRQGEQYVTVLQSDGYELVAQANNDASAGILLEKGGVHVHISLSENVLGIYLTFDDNKKAPAGKIPAGAFCRSDYAVRRTASFTVRTRRAALFAVSTTLTNISTRPINRATRPFIQSSSPAMLPGMSVNTSQNPM